MLYANHHGGGQFFLLDEQREDERVEHVLNECPLTHFSAFLLQELEMFSFKAIHHNVETSTFDRIKFCGVVLVSFRLSCTINLLGQNISLGY